MKPARPSLGERAGRLWKRRWVRALAWTAGVLVALRVLVSLLLPLVLSWVASSRGLDLDLRAHRLSVFEGELRLEGLRLAPKDGSRERGASGPALLELDWALFDIALGDLVKGDLRVERAEVDGLRAEVERKRDGSVPWIHYLGLDAPPEPEPEPEDEPEEPIAFDAPLAVDALRLQHVEIHVVDPSVAPPLDARLEVSARLSDLGSPERPAQISVFVHGADLLESLRVTGEGTSRGRKLDAKLSVALERLRLDPLRGVLDALGADLDREELAARADLGVALDERAGAPAEAAGTVEIAGVRVEGDGALLAELASLRVDVLALARDRAELALALEGGRALVRQNGAPPIELALERLALGPIALADPLPESRVALEVAASAPGSAAGLFASATAAVGPRSLDLDLELAGRGIALERLAPTLAELGLASELRDGALEAHVSARAEKDGAAWKGSFGVDNAYLADGGDLVRLDRAGVSDLAYDEAAGSLRIGAIELAGLSCAVRRDAEGVVHALGLRTIPGAPAPSAPAPAEAAKPMPRTPPSPAPRAIRSLALDKLSVGEIDLRLRDEVPVPQVEIATEGVALELADLALGGDTGHLPARFGARLALRPILAEAKIEGEVGPLPEQQGLARLEAVLSMAGFRAGSLAPYLAPLRIATEVESASGEANLDVVLTDLHGVSRIALRDAALADESTREKLAGAGEIALEGLAFEPSGPKIAELRLRELFLSAGRDAAGRLRAAGFVLAPQPDAETAPPAVAPASIAASIPDLPPFLPRTLALDGDVAWLDQALDPPLATRLAASLRCEGLHAMGIRPARIQGDVRSDQDFASIALGAQVLARRGALDVATEVEVEELRAGPLARYLPPGLALALDQGAFRAAFDAHVAEHPEGGDALGCGVRGLELRDAGAEEPLVSLPRAAVEIERLDVLHGVVRVKRCEVEGLALSAALEPDGTLAVAGIEIRPAPEGEPVLEPVPEPGAARAPAAAPRSLRIALSEVALERVSIDAPRLALADRRPGGTEIRSSLRLEAGAPAPLLAPDGGATTPLAFDLSAAVEPLARELLVEGRVDPFAEDPVLDVALSVAGIEGSAVAGFAPSTAVAIDGSGLTDGVLSAHVRGTLDLPKRARGTFDLSRGFGADLAVEAVDLRDGPDGERLAGVDAIHVDGVRVDPARSLVAVEEVEIEKPFFRARRDAEGIHALGLTLVPISSAPGSSPAEPAATEPAPEPPVASAVSASAPRAETSPGAGASAGGELSVKRFAIRGLDVLLTDEVGPRPVVVALTDLDVELARFTTRALSEPVPLAFHAYLGANRDGVEHPLFDEVAVAGRVQLRPELTGWMNVDLSALALTDLRGLADQAGVEIGSGTLDSSVKIRFQGARGISVGTDSTFTDLSLSEPENGPISRWLKLPAPLDVVLFLLENEADEHHVPVSVRLTEARLGTGEILRAAAGATAAVIASAVASSPLRLLGAVGIGGGGDEREVLELPFEPGTAELGAREAARLAELLRRTAENRKLRFAVEHAFGEEDLALVRTRANPTREDCLALAARVRQRKASLALERAELAAQARADLATSRGSDAAAARGRLASLDADLGRLERALDRIGDLLRPGAERREAQRTKIGCVELGRERGARLRQALLDAGVRFDRIQLKPLKVVAAGERSSIRIAVLEGG